MAALYTMKPSFEGCGPCRARIFSISRSRTHVHGAVSLSYTHAHDRLLAIDDHHHNYRAPSIVCRDSGQFLKQLESIIIM